MAVKIESIKARQFNPKDWNGQQGKWFIIGRDGERDKYLNRDGNWEESTISSTNNFFWNTPEEAQEAIEVAKAALSAEQSTEPTPPP